MTIILAQHDQAPARTKRSDAMNDNVLTVEGLKVGFRTDKGRFSILDGVDFTLRRGRTLCLVGESGCGKSVTALSIMGLLAENAEILGGSARLNQHELIGLDRHALRRLRGDAMAMIFQEPMTSLNPAFTIGNQLIEGIRQHSDLEGAAAREHAIEMLKRVRIPAAEQRMGEYPHQLSGGMRQRVMIAMALANDPGLLIADEPTTALDVTIQAQILQLIRRLQHDSGTAVLMITHDLGVVAEVGDDVAVMYAGRIVERGSVTALFDDPLHPYTIGLLSSIPRLDDTLTRLSTIPGSVPTPAEMPRGCRFSTRCPFADQHCREEVPPLAAVGNDKEHVVACWKAPIEHCEECSESREVMA
ncbi:ABC transporter ATP-binding protein [Phytohalomonas tamaricis]|uniref:ABC transporter ATP-binding protein n=1 Tax=Phytohalomonas tamaricis TaxID=2081032 RepID=UPI000D0AC521|nr:ABC transporter ATP-binding protein [Phytohalomonas tamaricis]